MTAHPELQWQTGGEVPAARASVYPSVKCSPRGNVPSPRPAQSNFPIGFQELQIALGLNSSQQLSTSSLSPSAEHKGRASLRSHTQRNGSSCTQAWVIRRNTLYAFCTASWPRGPALTTPQNPPEPPTGRISPTDTRSGGQEGRASGATAPSPHGSHIQTAHSAVYTD